MTKQKITIEGEFGLDLYGRVSFRTGAIDEWLVLKAGGAPYHDAPPELVAAAQEWLKAEEERTCELALDEFRYADGKIGRFREPDVCGGEPVVSAGLWHRPYPFEEHSILAALRYAPGTAERGQTYWLASYQFKPGEYFDEETKTVKTRTEKRFASLDGSGSPFRAWGWV